MSVKEHLIEFLKSINISQKDFAKEVGLSFGYVNAIRVSIQPKTLHKIATHFPELNTGWLLTGEGEMLKNEGPETKENCRICIEKERYIKSLEDRVEAQKKTIEHHERCIDMLKGLNLETEETGFG